MADKYSLWIVSPEGLIWSRVFDEVALGFHSAFKELGYTVDIVSDPAKITGTPIVFGANLAPMYKIALPDNSIIYNLEQVHPESRWFQPDYGYSALLRRHDVWDFSRRNSAALKQMGVESVVHCPVGYAPELSRIPKRKEDVDVLFIGGHHPRRDKILQAVTKGGAGLHQVYQVFGRERDEWMARGKIHLNLHKEPARLFEVVRVSYLLSNRRFVVSESGMDTEMEQQFKEGLVFCKYDELVDTCLDYLVKPKERKRIAEAGFELMRSMPQSQYLDNALEEHDRTKRRRGQKTRWNLPATTGGKPRIFVAIASYRDPECQATIRDLYRWAAHPERVNVGVCLQVDAEEDKDCMVNPLVREGQVHVRLVNHKESGGANWARNEALKLMNGEDYVLLIDSHMRFEPGWDETLLELLARCPAAKPVISVYSPNYDPPNKRAYHPELLLRVGVRKLGGERDPQLVHITGRFVTFDDPERSGIYPTPFCVANFIFGPASMVREVPIDPHIHFWGDEINYAARLWTHGYDIFQADRVLSYHYWVRKDKFHLHRYREMKTPRNLRSMERVRHLLGFAKAKGNLLDIEKYGLGAERSLADFWKFAGIDWKKRKVTKEAEEGTWNMAAREKSIKKAAKQQGKLPRIFVQIASYRDPDCQWTVKDLFEKASHPERISVGICWQFVPGEDDLCFKEPYPFPKQVRVQEVNAKKSKGVCWARSEVQKLLRDEEYTLQIDSHMRFEPGWDDLLISMWQDCEDAKAVLTCYAPGFTPPDTRERTWVFGMSAKEFDRYGIFLMRGAPAYPVDGRLPEKPMPGAFVSANMLFGPSSMVADVPYDPHLYFFGEEISMAVRLWTHGYNLYHPNRLVIFHDWDRGKRATHFSDHKDWTIQNDKAFARVRHMLGTEPSKDPEILRELDTYGLGTARTLAQYQEFSGVDFAAKTIADKAVKGQFANLAGLTAPLPGTKGGAIAVKAPAIINAKAGGQPRIFINIASYRDPECQWTVKDLFDKAAYPDRINAGICWQFDPVEDKHCFEVSTRPDQVRMMPVDWRDAEGVCWARHQTQQLWDGEDYTLMIDSHMRFVPGWDELMIKELAACESAKPLLSCSPAPYLPPDKLGKNVHPTVRRVKPFMADGNIRCQGEMLDRSPPKPLRGAFLVANFIFSRSEITPEVPYDPYLYFDQEEISYAARLYTHGWDVFSARQQFLYHYYNDQKVPGGSVRPLHWRDLHKEDNARIRHMRERGLKRFNHLTGYQESTDPDVLREIDKYGFGRDRSLAQYEQFSGVDFKRKIATERALRCQFIEDLGLYRDRPIRVPELDDPKDPARGDGNARHAGMGNGAAAAVARQQQPVHPPRPVQQPVALPAAAAAKLLEVGDFMPMFEVPDTSMKMRTLETYGGRPVLFAYLPASQPEQAAKFYHEMYKQSQQTGVKDYWQLSLMDDSVERLNAFRDTFKIGHHLCADPDRRIIRSLGILRAGETPGPVGFVLDRNLKITQRYTHIDAEKMAALMVNDIAVILEQTRALAANARTISSLPPALVVPNVFSPEFCAKCINAFRTGHTFEGTVGAGERKSYRGDVKKRIDHIVGGQLLAEVDDKFSRSFFPEIRKVFGFEVTHREIYKIGLYTGEAGGFFRQHRDNFDFPLGYRRIASTIHLNDDYEGGGLRFPEYDDNIYRPAAGSAIAFSGSTLHEALQVTKGERFIMVAFVHGREEEAYRRYYHSTRNEPTKLQDYQPVLRQFPELREGRWFYKEWYDKNVRFDGEPAAPAQPVPPPAANANQPEKGSGAPLVMVNTLGKHRPVKVFESKSAIVYDNFLPDDVYQKVYNQALVSDYEFINTKGKIARAWHLHDGFPLRGSNNYFYHAKPEQPKPDYVYPTKTDYDRFFDSVLAIQPEVQHMVGKEGENWGHFSVTTWIYPQGTGLSMHDDGSGVYTGAYVFFLNPTWRAHWGGLLLMMDEDANRLVYEHRKTIDEMDFYKKKWLHANATDELLLEQGFAKCIFPKGNRMVFIANNAYHMVTRVNEQAGDNQRMSLAGFFNRKK